MQRVGGTLKKLAKVMAAGLVLLLISVFIWSRFDSQAMPKIVDALRSVIGDRSMLSLESAFYTVSNKIDEERFALNHKTGNQALAAELSPKKKPVQQNLYTVTSAPGDLDGIVDLVQIDLEKSRLKLVCGTRDPAAGSGVISFQDRAKTLLAFSGGFQYKHDFCGIVVDGKVMRPMKKKAGTLIIYQDGRVAVGQWNRDFTKVKPEMKYIRQNMLLIDHGKFNTTAPYQIYALDGRFRIFRSAVGVTKNGELIYAAGNKLSAKRLAEVMIAFGTVSAICLDMNYGNATCGIFVHTKEKLAIKPLTGRFPNPGRFLGRNYRDFFYVARL